MGLTGPLTCVYLDTTGSQMRLLFAHCLHGCSTNRCPAFNTSNAEIILLSDTTSFIDIPAIAIPDRWQYEVQPLLAVNDISA